MVEVARRHSIGGGLVQIDILDPLVLLLPNYIHLDAIDNTAQGINSVGDLKKAVLYDP